MKNMPLVLKVVLNIVIYLIYWVFASLIVGIAMSVFFGGVNMLLADKIAIFLALLILVISLIFRKYCYIALRDEQEEQEEVVVTHSYTKRKKAEAKQKTEKKEEIDEQESDEEIKIYVDKEIK